LKTNIQDKAEEDALAVSDRTTYYSIDNVVRELDSLYDLLAKIGKLMNKGKWL